MGNLIDKEPKYNEGWGFCSSDPRTKNCNEVIDISATDSRGTLPLFKGIQKAKTL